MRHKPGKLSKRGGRPLAIIGILAAAIVVIIVVLSGKLSEPAKDLTVVILGDEGRNDILAWYTGLLAAPINTADMTPMREAGMNPFGVNVFLEQEVDEDKIRQSLQMARDAGFGWIKQQVLWSEIEVPQKGRYFDEKNGVENTWAKWDRIVDLAGEYGLQVIMRLDTSPDWARPGNAKIETPPDNLEDYGDFVHAVVSRYREKVKHFIVWNEPNTAFEWGNGQVNAQEYVRLLKTAYLRAKEANPDAVIIAAPLAPTLEVSQRAVNDVIFLQQMYDAGAKQWFDIMSANPYGLRSGPYDRRLDVDRDVNFSRPILIREVMVRNGDVSKPIWGSEMGWNALPPDFPQEPLFGRVTREQQADYTVAGYRRILEEWPWMGVVSLWHLRRAHEVNQKEQMYFFSLLDYDFTAYPIYGAVKLMTRDAKLAYRGFHQETHWALSFDSNWHNGKDERASLGGYSVADQPGATISFDFKGTDLSLVVAKGKDMGRFRVEVDGSPSQANKLARDGSGIAYFSLRSETPSWQEIVPVATGLDNRRHSVKIVTELEGDARDEHWVFDGFLVDSRRFNRALASLGIGSVILGLLVGVTGAAVVLRAG